MRKKCKLGKMLPRVIQGASSPLDGRETKIRLKIGPPKDPLLLLSAPLPGTAPLRLPRKSGPSHDDLPATNEKYPGINSVLLYLT